MFCKYRADYRIEDILDGAADDSAAAGASAAKFDERYALLGLLLDTLTDGLRQVNADQAALELLLDAAKAVKRAVSAGEDGTAALQTRRDALAAATDCAVRAGSLPAGEKAAHQRALRMMDEELDKLCGSGTEGYALLRGDLARRLEAHRQNTARQSARLDRLFAFCTQAFGDGQEMLILVTELTVNPESAAFIRRCGCDAYYAHHRDLLFGERQKELDRQIDALDLDSL
ncbi:MAG: hypothetical protein ACI4OL_00910 [Gemmiger sp.]